MATIVTNDQHYHHIARKIREKIGENTLYKPSEMASKIRSIVPVYSRITTLELSVSKNGTYINELIGTAFSKAVVDVDNHVNTESLAVSINGEYFPNAGSLFDDVVVDVPQEYFEKMQFSTSQNGIYNPPSGYLYDPVIVSVPKYESSSLDVSSNGHYVPSVGELFTSVNVSVSAINNTTLHSIMLKQSISALSDDQISSIRDYLFINGRVESVSFPNCKRIGDNAFSNCLSLVSYYLPLVEQIGAMAFHSCYKLTLASFLKCSIIGLSAFARCESLQTGYFPECSFIKVDAFYSCYRLLSLYLLSNSVVALEHSRAFSYTPINGYTNYTSGTLGSIFVPESLLAAYQSANNWTYFSSRFVGV